MSEGRLIEFDAPGAGKMTVLVADVPEGLQIKRSHLRPISPRRVQDGTLIVQTVWYNKKGFSLSVGGYADGVLNYFVTLFETNEAATFTVFDYTDQIFRVEYTKTIRVLKVEDSKDSIGSTRGYTVDFEQI